LCLLLGRLLSRSSLLGALLLGRLLSRSSLLGALLLRCLLSRSSLLGALLRRCLLSRSSLLGTLLLRRCLLSRGSLLGALLRRCLLSGSSLLGALLRRCLLSGGSLLGALLWLRLLGALLLRRLLLGSRLLGPLLLRLCRGLALFFLLIALRVDGVNRPEKHEQGRNADNSNQLHRNRSPLISLLSKHAGDQPSHPLPLPSPRFVVSPLGTSLCVLARAGPRAGDRASSQRAVDGQATRVQNLPSGMQI
jgi:hypothetical protein